MAGGVFAINRHYFNEIGQYDRDMKLSGAENLELSLRVIQTWLFKSLPLFRESKH